MEQEIFDFKLAQQKDGRAEETIRARIQSLRQVSKICDIDDPEIIKLWLSDTKNQHHFTKACTWSNKTKTKFIDTYSAYLRYKNIKWNPPHYQVPQKLPFIPTEQEVDLLIARALPRLPDDTQEATGTATSLLSQPYADSDSPDRSKKRSHGRPS